MLWPRYIWHKVTADYAGLFFRAEGGDSAAFGTTQADNSPRLSSVKHSCCKKDFSDEINLKPGEWSQWFFTAHAGNPVSGIIEQTSFLVSSGEVRPRNQAIRIFKRIA